MNVNKTRRLLGLVTGLLVWGLGNAIIMSNTTPARADAGPCVTTPGNTVQVSTCGGESNEVCNPASAESVTYPTTQDCDGISGSCNCTPVAANIVATYTQCTGSETTGGGAEQCRPDTTVTTKTTPIPSVSC